MSKTKKEASTHYIDKKLIANFQRINKLSLVRKKKSSTGKEKLSKSIEQYIHVLYLETPQNINKP